jgi:hypothetical protein
VRTGQRNDRHFTPAKKLKRLLSLAISLAILAVIYWRMDFTRLGPVFRNCDPLWMVLSLGMVVPLTLMTAWRLDQLMPGGARLGVGESNRLILVASVLNLVLPSKMGDLAKAWFIKERGHTSGELAFALVVFEKTCDMLSLLLWCAFGLLLYPHKDALFWLMTVFVVGGLVGGVALLGSRSFAEAIFKMVSPVAPAKIRVQAGTPANRLARNARMFLARPEATGAGGWHVGVHLVFTPAANLDVHLRAAGERTVSGQSGAGAAGDFGGAAAADVRGHRHAGRGADFVLPAVPGRAGGGGAGHSLHAALCAAGAGRTALRRRVSGRLETPGPKHLNPPGQRLS